MKGIHNRVVWLLVGMFAVAVTLQTVRVSAQRSNTLETNKVLAQHFHLDMIGKGQLDIAERVIAANCLIHLPGGTTGKGPERAREIAASDLKRYPKGIKLVHNIVLAEGDFVAFQWDLWGTLEAGEVNHLQGIDVVRIEDGKAAEMWIEYHTPKGS